MITPQQNRSACVFVFGSAVDKRTVARSRIAQIANSCANTNSTIETGVDTVDEARLIQLRKMRSALKIALAAALQDG